jgi:signal transduction histidine kinase
MVKWLCRFFLFFCCNPLYSQKPGQLAIIDSAKKNYTSRAQIDGKVTTAFFIADNFMDMDQYDSAQVWLNKIADIYIIKKPSLFNYYLLSRQAEVYYYNGLLQLGLQSAMRSLEVAMQLGDSLLLADACNMTGLFYTTMNEPARARPYFYKGIPFSRQPPYPPQYLSLAKPHHLLGNMAETLEKLNENDSSLLYSRRSLQKAAEIEWWRGVAVAHTSMGKVYYKKALPDSSYQHYLQAMQTAQQSGDIDVELVSYAGLALSEPLHGQAGKWLQKGFALMQQSPQVNALFTKDFLNMALLFYKSRNNEEGIRSSYAAMVKLDSTRSSNNTRQMQNILNISSNNENRLLKLEVAEVTQKQELTNTRLYIALLALLLMGGLFFIYRYYSRQKLKIAALKNTISQDLHDDVGASLSSLHIYSSLAEKMVEDNPSKAKELLKQITANTLSVMDNMGDIIWAMKPQAGDEKSLEAKIKNYGTSLLTAKEIPCTYSISPAVDTAVKNMEARKNILLIVKEALNNIAKYSSATMASVNITEDKEYIKITIADNGIGFYPDTVKKGNGLPNLQARCTALKGSCTITSSPGNGCTVCCLLPLTIIRETY